MIGPFRKPLDPLFSLLARPIWNFAVRRDAPGAWAELPPEFRVIAHRGGAGAPENSLAAARQSVSLGLSDIEVDIRQTRDGRWVCIHDPDLNRLAHVNRRVADLTFEQLRRIPVGRLGEPVPSLEELLAAVPDDVRLHLDLKGLCPPAAEAMESLLSVLWGCGAQRRVSVSGLLHPALERLRALDGGLALGYLTLWLKLDGALRRCFGGRHRPSHEPLRAIEAAARLGAESIEPVAIQPRLPDFIEAAHEAGLAVYLYTIDSASAAAQAAAWGADGIFTNVPERFLAPAL